MPIPKINRRQMLFIFAALSAGTLAWEANADDGKPAQNAELPSSATGRVPLVYDSRYDITAFGIEKLHPFDGKKFSGIHRFLLENKLSNQADFTSPSPLSEEQLLEVHTRKYLDSLKHSKQIAEILELGPLALVPANLLDWRILKPMRLAAGGTFLTCRKALEHGIAINIGGGYHHAECDQGGGFCVYSDVPIAISLLRKEGLLKKAMVVDTDAHQGNGFSNVLRDEPASFVLDLFDESIYPWPKVKENWSVAFPAKTHGDKYLSTLEEVLPKAIDDFSPDLIVYNAGSDVLLSDPLSTFRLSVQDMNDRDLFVVKQARKRKIPIAMVLAGGYGKDSRNAHAKSIEAILRAFNPLT